MTKDPQLEPEGRRLLTSAPARDVPVVSRVVRNQYLPSIVPGMSWDIVIVSCRLLNKT